MDADAATGGSGDAPATPRRCKFDVDDDVASILDDSGNYSINDSLFSDGGVNSDVQCLQLLPEKEQSLLLAVQDVRRLHSELERLSKSEQWYKQELRQQKSTRLESLERLYTQERKYMQENQRLQSECCRLYAKCAEMEQELQRTETRLKSERYAEHEPHEGNSGSSQFEIEQQQALIIDQQQLIAVLRKQKRALLDDMQRLAEEKDEKALLLQHSLARLQLENTHVTEKCSQLCDEREHLFVQLQRKASRAADAAAEREKLHFIVGDLRQQLETQEKLLAQREGEILELQKVFAARMSRETDVDEVHRLSLNYHDEINAKTCEIRTLKHSLLALQCELDSLQQNDANKTRQIAELQLSLEECIGEREAHAQQLQEAQSRAESAEAELISLHKRYADACALCERTKFELQLREIEQKKLQFQSEADRRDIGQLREKLTLYLHQTRQLGGRIATLEAELDGVSFMGEVAKDVDNIDQQPVTGVEAFVKRSDESMGVKFNFNDMKTESMAAGRVNKTFECQRAIHALCQLEARPLSKVHGCGALTQEFLTEGADVQRLSPQSLDSDAKLYKQQRTENQCDCENNSGGARDVEALRAECAELNNALKALREDKLQLQVELQRELTNSRAMSDQRDGLNAKRACAEQGSQTEDGIPTNSTSDQQAERIQSLQHMLQQRNDRVEQLKAAQAEWEQLLSVLQEQLQEQNRQELVIKSAELEELNELFTEQNEELQELHQHNRQLQRQQRDEVERMQETFQAQLKDLAGQLEVQRGDSEEKNKIITSLEQANARLQRRLDEDYADELAQHSKQTRTLQIKVTKVQQEREEVSQRLFEARNEVEALKRNKEARPMSSTLCFQPPLNGSSEAEMDERLSVSDESSTVNDDNTLTKDRIKILTRVLEAEYKRKMKRYELHVGTLLANVKALKRSLKSAEQKAAIVRAEHADSKAREEDLRLAKMHLEEMRLKYEQSQANVKALKQQLIVERTRYEASDLGKCASVNAEQQKEDTHEVPNLIDDYKKLIQQSAVTTQRLKTSAILDLIQRSNKCVPNLHKLEASVCDLHNDVHQFLSAYAEQSSSMHTLLDAYPLVGVRSKRPSLMDELRHAKQF